jgi:hypothetical protein
VDCPGLLLPVERVGVVGHVTETVGLHRAPAITDLWGRLKTRVFPVLSIIVNHSDLCGLSAIELSIQRETSAQQLIMVETVRDRCVVSFSRLRHQK